MFTKNKIINKLANMLSIRRGWRTMLISVGFVFLMISPLLAFMILSYISTNRNLTEAALSRRESIAYLAATTAKERLNRFIDIGVALATRVRFRQEISEGKWTEAIKLLSDVPKNFPEIDRIILTDLTGTLMADIPEDLSVRGKSFAFRDWYQGVSKNWQPYVSEVYERSAKPQVNVIAFAFPIKAESGMVVGILQFQIKVDIFLKWTKGAVFNDTGFIYFLDRKGHIVVHPDYSAQAEIAIFSDDPMVQEFLHGEGGIGIFHDGGSEEGQVIAYQPIEDYDWGVVVVQQTKYAFAVRDGELRSLAIIYGLIIFLGSISSYLLLYFLKERTFYAEELAMEVAMNTKFLQEATAKIREEHARNRAILDNMGEGLIVVDMNENIIAANKQAGVMFGLNPKELIGEKCHAVSTLEDDSGNPVPEENCPIHLAVSKNKVVTGNNYYFMRKDKTKFPTAITASPFSLDGGGIIGAIEILRDITDEMAIDRAKSEFISIASHQLRTPLTGIRWVLERFMKKEKLTKEGEEYLGDISISVKRLSEIVETLLSTSRIESGISIVPKPVEVIGFAEEFISEYAPLYAKKNLELSFKKPDSKIDMFTDPIALRSIFQNLLSNSIDYTPEGGRIELVLKKNADNLLIKVSDTGIGIPKDEQENIFKKFSRASNARLMKPDGTGLGLYVIYKAVGYLGGKIWFESPVRQLPVGGTAFYVELPLVSKLKVGYKTLS